MRLTFALLTVYGTALAQPRAINVHEHIQSAAEAARLVEAMDTHGIRTTALMGSSWFTVTLRQGVGFTRWEENNEELLRIVEAHPGRFEAWPTIDPTDPQKLEKLQGWFARGATGVKLYAGHGLRDTRPALGPYFFHPVAMDHPDMLPVYAWLEAEGVPVCFHVNPGPKTPGFAEEFVTVLTLFPDLKVNAPHFVLSSIRSSRLEALLDAFPNLYSDISFGHDSFLIPGLKRISRSPAKFRRLFRKYPDRFFFGTDVVVTRSRQKGAAWIGVRFQAYLDMLSKERYQTPLVRQPLRGLALDEAALRRVLWENYEAFKRRRPRGTRTRAVVWERMGVPRTMRPLGAFVPPSGVYLRREK